MAVFKCPECGGTLEFDKSYVTATCDSCAKQMQLTSEMRRYVEKLKAEAEKEYQEKRRIEFEKKRQIELEQQKEQERIKRFSESKIGKHLGYIALLCSAGCFFYFSQARIIAGIFLLIQAVLFTLVWIIGRGYIKKRINYSLTLLVSCLLFVPVYLTRNITFSFLDKSASPSITINSVADPQEGIYTYPIKNYVGKNLAACGTVSFNGYLKDDYGDGELKLSIFSLDGEYINPTSEKERKKYLVIGQSLEANSNLIIVHDRYDDGEPTLHSVDYQSHEEIILYVCKVKEAENISFDKSIITAINISPDRRTYYIRDYINRNAASFGKYLGGKRIDTYNKSDIKLVFTSTDGTYVDFSVLDELNKYVVIGQDPAPNSEHKLIWSTSEDGKESDYTILSQNFEEINLIVEKVDR